MATLYNDGSVRQGRILKCVVTGPAAWCSYLVNGDASALGGTERALADAWLRRITPWYVADVRRNDEGDAIGSRYTHLYDMYCGDYYGPSGGDVIDYVLHKVAAL